MYCNTTFPWTSLTWYLYIIFSNRHSTGWSSPKVECVSTCIPSDHWGSDLPSLLCKHEQHVQSSVCRPTEEEIKQRRLNLFLGVFPAARRATNRTGGDQSVSCPLSLQRQQALWRSFSEGRTDDGLLCCLDDFVNALPVCSSAAGVPRCTSAGSQ